MDFFNIRSTAVSILALGDVTSCYDPLGAVCPGAPRGHSRMQRPLEPIETAIPLIAVNISTGILL